MNSEIACMVDYSLVEIEEDQGPFRKGEYWADADLEQAAEYMKKLAEDREFGREMAEKAKKQIRQVLSVEQAAEKIDRRMEEIRKKRI